MFGQGRPRCRGRPISRLGLFIALRGSVLLLAFALGLRANLSASASDAIDVRIRVAWGGGEARSWHGAIRLSEGTLSEVTPLGLEADAPGSLLLIDPTTIRVCARAPRSYDGCDVHIQAPASAKLAIQLSADDTFAGTPVEMPLAKVVKDFTQVDLDERKNRLLAQRSPGDALRVRLAYPSLIFAPGEKFQLEVQPQQLDFTSASTYTLSVALGPARTEETTWSEEREVKLDESNSVKPVPLTVPLPDHEGVFDVRLALYPKRLASSILRTKPLATRKVQVVVLAPLKPATTPLPWQSIFEIDPANPKWWDRMAVLPSWTRLPTVPRPVESSPATTRTHLGQAWVELPPRAWQAYPLSMNAPGLPHVIELEYPSDLAQTLAISLIEPNAAGFVGPIGLDSGIDVSAAEPGHKAAIRRHRLVCWPQTKTPYLLLVNRRDAGPAVFGRINVQAGSPTLPPLAISSASFPTRTLAAYYDKPLFAENFSASESLDPVSHRGFDDWMTFASAGVRLTETLQHAGYNALILTAACEGSAIYPSRLLEPTPKYDSGVFFESGQDAMRKDILEFLFRLCDRSGLVLVPGVQFAGPLPALEVLRASGGENAVGLEPVGPDGRTPLARSGTTASTGVLYNLLDERVQNAMTAVVEELAERYGHHASFGGVAVQMNAESYALLPDETCSLDDVTFARFISETKTTLSGALEQPAERWTFVRRSAAQAWLDWRADNIASFYKSMRETVSRRRTGAKLYLTTANLLSTRQLQTVLRPELPAKDSVEDVLRLLGIDCRRLDDKGIVFPRPQRIVPAITAELHEHEQHWNGNLAMDRIFSRAAKGAAMNFLVPSPLRLPAFDSISPFGADKTRLLLVSQIAPADAAYRKRFVENVARLDATTIIDGGWLLPLGQEAALAPLAKVYRRLPAEPFEAPPRRDLPQEVVVRTLAKGDKTYFYAANQTPWPLTAHIQFSGAAALRVTPYGEERQATVQSTTDAGLVWSVDMEPFDLVGGEVSSGNAKVASWSVTVPEAVSTMLGEQSRDVVKRVRFLQSQPHVLALKNASFEDRRAEGTVVDWVSATGTDAGIVVETDRTTGSGSPSSLHLAHRGAGTPVWVRSSPIATPATGRIQVRAKIRIADDTQQPQLRLAIEGRLDGQTYYRRINYGAAEREGETVVAPLTTEWTTCSLARTDLPLSGLTDLRVGFDLMSDGEVWIDEVQVQDLWLPEDAAAELLKSAATAELQARSGGLHECRLFVDGYWPSFLRRHVQLPDGREMPPLNAAGNIGPVTNPPASSAPAATGRGKRGPAADSAKKQNWLERSAERNKSWLPSWMKWK